ncbi:hypothetical protein [Limosilactobacillus reuteri]|uniref:hypothetical protein n=2 Tax=Limosilactobacillus reuteri TaxID=1598 RepID=UPI003CFFBCE9
MHTKIFTINGNFYEAEGGIDDILRKFKLNGTTGLYIYGLAMRNLQTVPHRVIIPVTAVESIMEFEDDEDK